MSNKAGAVIGAIIDRRDGDSGIKGAIEGSLIEGAIKLVLPILGTLALGMAVRYGIKALSGTFSGSAAAPQ